MALVCVGYALADVQPVPPGSAGFTGAAVRESLRHEIIGWSDFLSGATDLAPFSSGTAGGASLTPVSGIGVGFAGITAVNAYARVGTYVQPTSANPLVVARLVFRVRGSLHPILAPTATEDYTSRMGFSLGTGSVFDGTEGLDAAYFRVSYNGGDTSYYCVTRNDASETATDSNVAFSTAQKTVEIVLTPGVDAKFYYDNALVCTHTTNLPNQGIGIIVETIKTVGSTERVGANIDYMFMNAIGLVTER